MVASVRQERSTPLRSVAAVIPRPIVGESMEYLLRHGEIEAALILDPSWGSLSQRERELVEKAWVLGLRTGKQIANKK